jgi:hypothetical protein
MRIIFDEAEKLADPEQLGLELFYTHKLTSEKQESYFGFLKRIFIITFFVLAFFFLINETFTNLIYFVLVLFVFIGIVSVAFLVPYMINEVIKTSASKGITVVLVMFLGLVILLGVFA